LCLARRDRSLTQRDNHGWHPGARHAKGPQFSAAPERICVCSLPDWPVIIGRTLVARP